ncbi:hypothetical protein MRX96_007529 [Rhipicephalus microplus]
MAAFSRAALYIDCREMARPDVLDDTVVRTTRHSRVTRQRAQGNPSDLDLSDSDNDTIVDLSFSAPLQSFRFSGYERGDDGPSISISKSFKVS